jgi:hypothetical protein
MKLVIVSPHLDDAAASLGATIAALSAAEVNVVVATVCSLTVDRRRIDEDIAAVATLGAAHVHLGLPDAPLRGYEETWGGLVDVVDDEAFTQHVAEALARVVQGAVVWGPLGVGGHVDHRATTQALWRLGCRTMYEERPYARQTGAVRAAWQRRNAAIVDEVDPIDVDEAVAFLDRVGAPGRSEQRMPTLVMSQGIPLRRDRRAVGVAGRERRLEALRCYVGQWPLLVDPSTTTGWPWDDEAEVLWRPDVH